MNDNLKTTTSNNNLGGHFYLNGRFCLITVETSFGGINHYGFITIDEEKRVMGWVPSEMVTLH